jgi:hypothetical protein
VTAIGSVYLSNLTKSCLVLPSLAWSYKFLPYFLQSCWVLLSLVESYNFLLSVVGSCWVLLSLTTSCWVLLGLVESWRVLLSLGESCLILLSLVESCWLMLNYSCVKGKPENYKPVICKTFLVVVVNKWESKADTTCAPTLQCPTGQTRSHAGKICDKSSVILLFLQVLLFFPVTGKIM